MFTNLDRSRAHVALNDIWANDCPRRAAYAALLALNAGDPDQGRMLLLFELLDLVCAEPVDIDFVSVMEATGLDADAVELALAAAGARERGVRDWTSATPGEAAEQFVLTRGQWRDYLLANLGLK